MRGLSTQFHDKIDRAAELVHHICGRYAVFEKEHSKWLERERELNESKRVMEEQMKKENEALGESASNACFMRSLGRIFSKCGDELVMRY